MSDFSSLSRPSVPGAAVSMSVSPLTLPALADQSAQQLVFIDRTVADIDALIHRSPATHVYLLDSDRNGLEQMTAAIAQHQNVAAIHVLSHGAAGTVQLGNTALDAQALAGGSIAAQSLQQWASSLTADADVLFYGCHVAAGTTGTALVQQIGRLTGADVAASDDLTGGTVLGGDWQLEVTTGAIEATLPGVSEALQQYDGTLALYQGRNYVLTASLTWEQAQAEARRLGGNLVTVNDAAEETWLKQTFGSTEAFWIGLNDARVEGTYEWASGETSTYRNWAPGEPNNFNGNEDYIQMNFGSDRRWNDESATRTMRGIIELAPKTRNGSTYLLTSAKTWEAAQTEAAALGGNLVTVNDAAEEDWLKQNYGSTEAFWIGLNDRTTEGTFVWASGETASYRNWAPGEPNNARGNEDFVQMNFGSTRQWNDESPTRIMRGIIELRGNTFNGNTYFTTSAKTWEAAQAEAVSLGGNLVTINDVTEENWLKQTFGTTEFWIGLNDARVEGTYEWASGETSTYRNWAAGEPNNFNGNEDYVQMNFASTGQWNDESATRIMSGIIEVRGSIGGSSIALEQNAYSIGEGGGTLSVAVVRSGDTSGTATVQYRIDNGTPPGGAIAGQDFTGGSGTLTFAAGVSRQTISIPILQDTTVEGTETFSVVILSPTGANLGTTRTATVSILDDDGLALTVDQPRVLENAGSAVITVRRASGAGTASVDFATANGTAIAGSDYTTTSGRVTFAAGVTSQTITIPLLNDTIGEPNETFVVNFSNPVGVTLPTPPQSTVTILDDDAGSFVRETFISGLTAPTAFVRTPDNALMFILEKSGLVKVARGNTVEATPFIDLRDRVNDVRDRGALGLAIHPDFNNGSPFIYVSYTYDPPEAATTPNDGNSLNDRDQQGNRPAQIVKITADAATGFTRAVAGSAEVIVGKNSTWANTSRPDGNSTFDFSIPESGRNPDGTYIQDYLKTDSESHTIGQLAFGADKQLYVSVGDGTSYNSVDPRTTSVLNVNSLSGKVLRIDPITGAGLSDNPFFTGDVNSNASKVWNLGLRNPFRTAMKPGTSTLFIGDVGWKLWEEVNVGTRGANFGWAAFEGGTDASGNPISIRQPEYDARNIPEIEAFYTSGRPVTAPIFARNHNTGARAIVVGDFYDGTTFPSVYNGALFVADVNEGTVDALTIDDQNRVTQVRRFASGVPNLVYFETGPDGNLYYVDIAAGAIGRWRPA